MNFNECRLGGLDLDFVNSLLLDEVFLISPGLIVADGLEETQTSVLLAVGVNVHHASAFNFLEVSLGGQSGVVLHNDRVGLALLNISRRVLIVATNAKSAGFRVL